MKRYLTALIALYAIAAYAVTPIGHDDVLKDNAKIISKMEAASADDDEANPYFLLTGEADQAIANGDYVTAILRLKDAIRVDPDNPANALLYSNLGMVYGYLDQDSLAMKAYDTALEIAPAMSTVRCNRALLNLRLGNDIEAFKDFTMVIERDSLNANARYYHGIMSLYAGDLEGATDDFDVLKSVEPTADVTCIALATLYSLTGRDLEAIPYYKELISKDPAPEYYSALAGCYLATSQLTDASAIIAEGLQKCGDDPELYYYRAWLNKESYLYDAAKADAKRAIQLGADPKKVNRLFSN